MKALALATCCVALFSTCARADEIKPWSDEQKQIYQEMLKQYPQTVEKGFRGDDQKKYWAPFVNGGQSGHVSIVKASFSDYTTMSVPAERRREIIYKSVDAPAKDEDLWQIGIDGRSDDDVLQTIFILIRTKSHQIVLAWRPTDRQ